MLVFSDYFGFFLHSHFVNFFLSQLTNVIEMSLAAKPQMRLSSSLLYERLADFLRDTAEDADIQDYFWEVFDQLIQDKMLCSEKVILEHVSCHVLYIPSQLT
jgi:hypothetical protein